MLVAGVDDAGRGCAIGPLVIAGVMLLAGIVAIILGMRQ